jgi:hypothetical protein
MKEDYCLRPALGKSEDFIHKIAKTKKDWEYG